MAMNFMTQHKYDVVKYKKPELLDQLKEILGDSFIEDSQNGYEEAITRFLEDHLHQGTIAGNLWYMLNHFSDHPSDEMPDIMVASYLINSIMDHQNEIYRNIEKKCK